MAETALLVRTGISHCLAQLPGLQVHPIEVRSPQALMDTLRSHNPRMLIVNPNFGGVFDPDRFRRDYGEEMKIVAIEVTPLDPAARNLYDDTISVLVDDSEAISRKIRSLLECREEREPKEVLSQREREILVLVVKGLTNKDIADTLFLSPHTVLTHRRNIARKLDIHSATGLTIYAIVNRLVDISEIDPAQ